MDFRHSLPVKAQKDIFDALYNMGYTSTGSFPRSKDNPDWLHIEASFEKKNKTTLTALKNMFYEFMDQINQPPGNLI